ncbi:MAG: hypothetical protein AABY32_00730 [Nanoarchaeota archaeon]
MKSDDAFEYSNYELEDIILSDSQYSENFKRDSPFIFKGQTVRDEVCFSGGIIKIDFYIIKKEKHVEMTSFRTSCRNNILIYSI